MGLGGTLIVAGVWVLIGFIGLTSQYFVFWDYLGGLTAHTLTVLGGFNILLALLCYNYYLACRVDPGRVPRDWEPPANPEEVLVIEVKKNNAGPRYCRVCKHFKPPRTHHCSSCQRCVLKMDHHCPWLNNCIGYYNYGYFIRFLIYVDLTCAYCLVLLCRRVWQLYANRRNWSVYYAIQPSQTEFGFLLVNLILDTIVLFLVGVLSIYHLWLLIDNTTTIETFEKDRIKKLVRRRIVSQLNYPYDVGFVGNIKQVLGPTPWLWLWPQAMPKGGVMFPIAPHLRKFL
ncbi:Palmitoyltransferase [Dimargaris xerosporica]|nr:Palmitoyltransferase [Dimargaris xerosporica]